MSVHGPKSASTSATEPTPADRGQASRARGVALVAAAGLLWSTFGLGVRLMGDVGPWAILFYRAIPQIIVLVVLITVRHRGATLRTIAGIGLNGLVSGASLTFSSMCFVYALTLTTVAEATLILGAAPVLAGVLGWLILREPITRTNWWTMGIAAAGLGIMTYTGTVSGSLAGTILAFGAALGFAAFTVFQRRGMRTDMLPAVIVSGLVTLLVTGPLVGGVTISGMNIVLAIYLGGVALAGGLALFTAGSRHVRSTELVLIAMLEVVFAPVWVWWALGEGMAVATMVGGAIILTAVLIQAREGQARFRRAGPMPPVSAP